MYIKPERLYHYARVWKVCGTEVFVHGVGEWAGKLKTGKMLRNKMMEKWQKIILGVKPDSG